MSNKGCTVPNCYSKHKARGLCRAHYMTELRHESGIYQTRREPRMYQCQAAGCSIKLSKPALCGVHYAAVYRKPKPKKAYKAPAMKQVTLPCITCGATSFSNNMCKLHYNAFKLSPTYSDGLWEFVKQELKMGVK